MNLDETSVCLFQGTSKGNVSIQKPCHLVQQVPFWKRRCCMTHVAVVCDRAEVQAVLPQVVIGNHVAFLQRDVPALRAGLRGAEGEAESSGSEADSEALCPAIIKSGKRKGETCNAPCSLDGLSCKRHRREPLMFFILSFLLNFLQVIF